MFPFFSNGRISEVIDANDDENICSNFGSYPIDVHGATGGLIDDQPIICQGFPYSNACYVVTGQGNEVEST